MKWLLTLLLLVATTVSAKEVKMIVAYSAGGPIDTITRTVAKHLNNDRYKFVPEFRLGAGGAIAVNHLAGIKDETAIMVMSNALVNLPVMTNTANYVVDRDFTLLGMLGYEPLYLVVKNKGPIKDYKQFINYAKNNPMPYGSGGVGTSGHITGAIIAQNNTNMFHVPYKGSAGILIDVLNDNIKWIVDSDINIGAQVSDNKILPIATYFNRRTKLYPNVPTLKELAVDDRDYYRWFVLIANKNADPEIVKYISDRLRDPALKNELTNLGLEHSQVNLQTFLLDETVKIRRIVRDYQIQ